MPSGVATTPEFIPPVQSDLEQFVCPECLTGLRSVLCGLQCSNCSQYFPIVRGIPVFSAHAQARYSTMPPEDLSRIHGLVQAHGWQKGVTVFLESLPVDQADYWATYMLSELSAAGKLLLNLDPAARVLDLGCGTGTFSVNLAHQVREVTALDLGLTQLQLLKSRAEEAGVDNLRLVCAGDRSHLPFPDASFDIVLLNGVLKWIAWDRPGNPRDLQIKLLSEINRILKPSGLFYLATSNRFSHEYLSGSPEENTKLRFVTILPRALAQILSRCKTSKPYRGYTYSRWGIRKLLRESGFSTTHFYVSRPNYRLIEHLSDGERGSRLGKNLFVKTRLKAERHGNLKARLLPYLAHSYSIIASKSALPHSFADQAIEKLRLWRAAEQATASSLELSDLLISETGAAVAFVNDPALRRNFVMKIPVSLEARARLAQGFENLQALRSALPSNSALLDFLPEPLVNLECQRQPLYVESRCPGSDLKHCYQSHADRQGVYRLGLDFLLLMHRETRGGLYQAQSSISCESWLAPREKFLAEMIPATHREVWLNLILRVRAFFRETPPAPVWNHGDLWPANMIANEQGDRLTGVVDWSYSERAGIPVADLLQLLLVTKGQAVNRSFSQVLAARMTAGRFEKDEQGFVDEYCGKLSVPAHSIWALSALAWIDWIYRRTPIRGSLLSWRRSEIDGFLDVIGNDLR